MAVLAGDHVHEYSLVAGRPKRARGYDVVRAQRRKCDLTLDAGVAMDGFARRAGGQAQRQQDDPEFHAPTATITVGAPECGSMTRHWVASIAAAKHTCGTLRARRAS